MHVRGDIFRHRRLVFHDGGVGDKLLILLNTPKGDEPYFFVKTTSQRKDKPADPGCIAWRSLFFVAAGRDFFAKDTWVQLDQWYPMVAGKVSANPDCSKIGKLGAQSVKGIVDCLFLTQEEDLPNHLKPLLRPTIARSLQDLAEVFSSRRC